MIIVMKRVANIFLKAYHVSLLQVLKICLFSSNPSPIRCNLRLFQFYSQEIEAQKLSDLLKIL